MGDLKPAPPPFDILRNTRKDSAVPLPPASLSVNPRRWDEEIQRRYRPPVTPSLGVVLINDDAVAGRRLGPARSIPRCVRSANIELSANIYSVLGTRGGHQVQSNPDGRCDKLVLSRRLVRHGTGYRYTVLRTYTLNSVACPYMLCCTRV